ncbi:MAG: ATP synthase F1 subunit gamma [Crocinitomicaceae bacterium]|nr:ATP synthase F1 subunit gamma [Crocinitomicaceae bacterium]MDG1776255.1 ATP synthase F1 subunit gamma [Crocinitomicaceae bacterium]
MANLKEIRNRITSVSSTMQITSAMKMVSAAKLKRAQDAITQMKPYAEKLQEILGNLSATLDLSENAYSEVRETKNVLIIGITSNRGLCGGFNNNIFKKVSNLVNEEYKDANPKVLCLGKKIKDLYKKTDNYYINDEVAAVEDIFADLSFENSAVIAESAMNAFVAKEFDKVVVVYNSFINAASQEVKAEQLLPIIPTVNENEQGAGDYIFEPGKSEIVEDLIPKSLKVQLFKGLLDSNASEHGARMTAMHKATDNADDLKRNLTLSYNKARQAAITNEILEIVGGAEALNG